MKKNVLKKYIWLAEIQVAQIYVSLYLNPTRLAQPVRLNKQQFALACMCRLMEICTSEYLCCRITLHICVCVYVCVLELQHVSIAASSPWASAGTWQLDNSFLLFQSRAPERTNMIINHYSNRKVRRCAAQWWCSHRAQNGKRAW